MNNTSKSTMDLNLHIRGTLQFKPALFKNQLYFGPMVRNMLMQKGNLSYMWKFDCVGGQLP